jgi:hypothetical protein
MVHTVWPGLGRQSTAVHWHRCGDHTKITENGLGSFHLPLLFRPLPDRKPTRSAQRAAAGTHTHTLGLGVEWVRRVGREKGVWLACIQPPRVGGVFSVFGALEAINPIIMARPPQPPIQCSMYTLGGLHYSTECPTPHDHSGAGQLCQIEKLQPHAQRPKHLLAVCASNTS